MAHLWANFAACETLIVLLSIVFSDRNVYSGAASCAYNKCRAFSNVVSTDRLLARIKLAGESSPRAIRDKKYDETRKNSFHVNLPVSRKVVFANIKATAASSTGYTCSISFENSVSEPPTLAFSTPEPVSSNEKFLAIFRDTHPDARGWIHGFQKGLPAGSTSGKFGDFDGAGQGEYAKVQPPSGSHLYEILIFDKDYNLGPKLSAIVGTPWNSPARAMGSEFAVIEDLQAGNHKSKPEVICRCSVSVSHDQLLQAHAEM